MDAVQGQQEGVVKKGQEESTDSKQQGERWRGEESVLSTMLTTKDSSRCRRCVMFGEHTDGTY